jgi:hypothetical protein
MTDDPYAGCALIVVDAQQGFDDPSWGVRNNPACDDNIADLVDELSSHDRPLVYVRHDGTEEDSPLTPGHAGQRTARLPRQSLARRQSYGNRLIAASEACFSDSATRLVGWKRPLRPCRRHDAAEPLGRASRHVYFVAATQIAWFSVRTLPLVVVSGTHASVTSCQIRSRTSGDCPRRRFTIGGATSRSHSVICAGVAVS